MPHALLYIRTTRRTSSLRRKADEIRRDASFDFSLIFSLPQSPIYIPITRSQQQQHDVLSPVRGRTCVSSAPPRNTLHRRGAPRSRRERSLGGIPNFNAQLAVSSGDCVYGHKERPETGPAFICQTAPAEDYKGAAESARGDTGRMLRVYVYVYTRLSPRDR